MQDNGWGNGKINEHQAFAEQGPADVQRVKLWISLFTFETIDCIFQPCVLYQETKFCQWITYFEHEAFNFKGVLEWHNSVVL